MNGNEVINNEHFFKELQDRVVDRLLEEMKPPKFNGGKVPTNIASMVLQKNEQGIREALKSGTAPYGYAVQKEAGNWEYHISPKKFYEYCGFIYYPDDWKDKKIIG